MTDLFIFFASEAILYRLAESDLIHAGISLPKTSLQVGKPFVLVCEIIEALSNHALCNLCYTGGQTDQAVAGEITGALTWLQQKYDNCVPPGLRTFCIAQGLVADTK